MVLYKSYRHTHERLQELSRSRSRLAWVEEEVETSGECYHADRCGYLDGVDVDALVNFSREKKSPVTFLARPGSFVYAGQPIIRWNGKGKTKGRDAAREVSISEREPIDVYATGFKHLVEVAIKAASPAINDPATAMTAVNYLTQLFKELAELPRHNAAMDDSGGLVFLGGWAYEDLLRSCFTELRCYLDSDPWAVDNMRANLRRIADSCGERGQPQGQSVARQELQLLEDKP